MRNTLFIVFLWIFTTAYSQKQITVSGRVTDDKNLLPDVTVMVKETGQGTKTDSEGWYKIRVTVGQVLQFSHLGMVPVEVITEDVTTFLNIAMYPNIEELDEVTVKKRKRSQKELEKQYSTNKNLIRTAFGIIDKERSGFRIKIVEGKDLSLGGADFTYALPGIMAGIRVERSTYNSANPVVYLPRRFMSILNPRPVLFEVDGQLFTEAPLFINTANIERIAIIGGAGALVRYGSIAAGGLIVINTKAGTPGSEKPYDMAKLGDNYFKDDTLDAESQLVNSPNYSRLLSGVEDEQDALKIYREQLKIYGSSYHFILTVYRHFAHKLENKQIAQRIIEENIDTFYGNPVALKALAYHYQTNGEFNSAHQIYKQVFMLRPSYVQSYLDLARSYREIGKPRRAVALYTRCDYLFNTGLLLDKEGIFKKIFDHEFNNLLALKTENFIDESGARLIPFEDDFEGIRLVFEWNDSEAEFELQFVNPDKQYFVWEHGLYKNPERIKNEKQVGYAMEEYLIDNSLKGTWMVNAKYLGNKSITPTYLKVSIYHDYGKPGQRKEIKLFKLRLKEVNQHLFSISNAI